MDDDVSNERSSGVVEQDSPPAFVAIVFAAGEVSDKSLTSAGAQKISRAVS
jgi:hypothetical protein